MINLLRVIQQVNFLIEKMMSSLYRCKLDDDEQFVGAQESHARCTQCRRVCRSTNWTYTKTFSSRIARTKMDDRLWSCPARVQLNTNGTIDRSDVDTTQESHTWCTLCRSRHITM